MHQAKTFFYVKITQYDLDFFLILIYYFIIDLQSLTTIIHVCNKTNVFVIVFCSH